MVAINKKRIHCVVIAMPIEALASRGALAHEMVPGADPYVAQLIARLQDEVREERRSGRVKSRLAQYSSSATQSRFEPHDLQADLEIPWFDMPLDDEPLGDDSVPEFGSETNDDAAPAW